VTKLPYRASAFVIAVTACGALAVAVALFDLAGNLSRFYLVGPINSPYSVVSVLILFAVAALASAVLIPVPEDGGARSSHSLSAVGVLSCALVFPAYAAIPIVTAAALAEQLARRPGGIRRPFNSIVFNTSSYAIQTAAAAFILDSLGGSRLLTTPHLPSYAPRLLLAVLGAVAASYVISYGLTVTIISLSARIPATEVFRRSHRNTILPEATAAVVGVLFGYTWLTNPPLAPIALLPLAVIYVAFRNFIRLQELDRLKSNFITEVSHELRTPLSAILASSELLYHHGDMLNEENVRELSRSSFESSNHLYRLVENLLNATTLQSGNVHIKPVAVALDELIGDAATQVQPFLESKQQTLSTTVPDDLPEVLADPQHIVQVFINLLTNASKYSEAKTVIGISCTAEPDQVRIAVTDQGIGIPEEEQRHIFERFYRVPSQTMTPVVGSGLGLTIVKSLVEMHRGRVGVDSSPGAGSVFWFTLPQVSMAHGT
jgi:signal transduction histidine kinase